MAFFIHGIGVSGGIAIGRAQRVTHGALEVVHYVIPDGKVEDEIRRFEIAHQAVKEELEQLLETVPKNAPPELETFLQLHLLILQDPALAEVPKMRIADEGCNAEWALKQQMDGLVAQFEAIEDSYLRERRSDVKQVTEYVLKTLMGHKNESIRAVQEKVILVAHDLSPADMILFKEQAFAAFVTDVGGRTSHTAILARSLNIPSIVALHHAWSLIRDGEVVIVDGRMGVVIVDPDREVIAEYRIKQDEIEIERLKLKRLRLTRPTTLDGVEVELHANIELPGDIDQVKQSGATGVGLFRTEFLFMNRPDLPDEEEQFEAYRQVTQAMKGQPVTIRTLDAGADKRIDSRADPSLNPALGLRAIRYCLAEPMLFNTQIRAILRASHFGPVRLLIPMLSSSTELNQALSMIDTAKMQLREENQAFDESIPIGGMIEVPAAALSLRAFLDRLQFLSIGTNDLIQYTLAIDRSDESVAHLYDPLHPAIIYLLAHTIRNANRAGVSVSVCGEVAGEPSLTRLLLGFGLRQFSMHPAHIPAVKQAVLKSSLVEGAPLIKRILATEDRDRVEELVARLNRG